MSFTGQLLVDEVSAYTGLGGAGETNPNLHNAFLANGCIQTDDAAPKQAPSLVAELVAAPVNTFKIGR